MAWQDAMVQGAGITFGRIAIVAIALGLLLSLFSSKVNGQDLPPHPASARAFLIDDCEPAGDLPGAWLAHAGPPPNPAPRTIQVLWVEHRAPKEPLRGTGNEWLYMPFNGCGGEATGDMDLRNPSGEEAVRGARYLAIGFRNGRPNDACRCRPPKADMPFRLPLR